MRAIGLLVIPALMLVGADAPKKGDAKAELKKLEGKWQLVGAAEGDHVLTEADALKENDVYTFKDDNLTTTHRGKKRDEFKIVLHPDQKPAGIDFVIGEGKVNHASYSLEGDKLQIAVNNKFRANMPTDRPKALATKDLKHGLLFVFKRAK